MTAGRSAVLLAGLLTTPLLAMAQPASPPVTRSELVTTAHVRVALVEMAPGAEVPAHQHTEDHLMLTLTDGELIESVDGAEPLRRTLAEGVLDFVPAGRRHALRNGRDAAFRGVTIDFLQPQTGGRNRCAALLPGLPLDCPEAPSTDQGLDRGILWRPQLAFEGMAIAILNLAPGALLRLKASPDPPVIIPLATTEGMIYTGSEIPAMPANRVGEGGRSLRAGEALPIPADIAYALGNSSDRPDTARFLFVSRRAP